MTNHTAASPVLPAARSPIEQLEAALGCTLTDAARHAEKMVAGGFRLSRSASSPMAAGVQIVVDDLRLQLDVVRDRQRQRLAAAPRYALGAEPDRAAPDDAAAAAQLEKRLAVVDALRPLVKKIELSDRLRAVLAEAEDLRLRIERSRQEGALQQARGSCEVGAFPSGARRWSRATWSDAHGALTSRLEGAIRQADSLELMIASWDRDNPSLGHG